MSTAKVSTIKELLEERGMTVQNLADDVGVSKRTLDPYIAGKSKWRNARGHLLIAVADALEVDPHALIEKADENK